MISTCNGCGTKLEYRPANGKCEACNIKNGIIGAINEIKKEETLTGLNQKLIGYFSNFLSEICPSSNGLRQMG